MTSFHFYFSVCLLLPTLNWRTSTGLPVPNLSADNKNCASLFKSLLLNVAELLSSEDLCHGLIPSNEMTMWSSDTVQACAPNLTQNSSCMMQRNSSFSESECLRSIIKDLAYYKASIQHYLQSDLNMRDKEVPLLTPTVEIIEALIKNCSLMANGENSFSETVAANMWKEDSYKNRQKMCKMMRGFHVRAITINRAMGYISSGDHRK
ncbi:interleukin-12 subunit alpha [Melanotaenia boesemani]|uniref:interleukin-12 subunit alpha n=1 Tax=Melanotaenia boesemani TaxID=1250792 RepID=UPI001C051240|nr:interleukin-12 subunit alpha [Melanotaenia boesemani]